MKRLLAFFSVFALLTLLPAGLHAQTSQSGTEIKVRLVDRLNTGETRVGQRFAAVVEEPVRLDRRTVLARGTTVYGTVTEVVSSGRLKRPASITLQLTGLGKSSLRTEPLQIDGKSHAGRDAAFIGGGAAAGAILGAVAGGGKGALIGSAAGAGAGTGAAFATGKKEIDLPSETELVFVVGGNARASSRPASAGYEPPAPTGSYGSERAPQDPPQFVQEQAPPPPGAQYPYAVAAPPPSSGAQLSVGILIGPPPPPRVIYATPAPAPDFVWVQGYWYPVGRQYVWHEGYWTRPPYEGAYWVAPHYDGERYYEGYWNGKHGKMKHHHHGDRDRDDQGEDHDRDDHDRHRDRDR